MVKTLLGRRYVGRFWRAFKMISLWFWKILRIVWKNMIDLPEIFDKPLKNIQKILDQFSENFCNIFNWFCKSFWAIVMKSLENIKKILKLIPGKLRNK